MAKEPDRKASNDANTGHQWVNQTIVATDREGGNSPGKKLLVTWVNLSDVKAQNKRI